MRLVLLDEGSIGEWDSTWRYVGPTDDALVVQRVVGDRVEIGLVDL